MKTNIDALKTDNHTITTLVILISILIVPLLFIGINEAWDYHVNCIAEDKIDDYIINNLEDETATCLGQSVTDKQIISWWWTGNSSGGTVHVFEFQKKGNKYSLLRKTAPGFEKYDLYSLWSSNHGFYLITDPNCVKATYTLNETLHTVPVDTVPYVFSVPGFPVDVILHSADTAE